MPKALIRVPKSAIVKDNGDTIWIDMGERDDFLRQVMLASVNEGKAVMKKGADE